MTISSETFRWPYTVTVGQVTFPYTNKIIASTDLNVYVNGVLKTESTDYTVSGVGDDGGGNVVFLAAPTTGATVLIVADGVEFTQETHYIEGDSFPASSHEDALDKVVRLCQKIWDYTRRSIKLPVTSTLTDLELPTPSGGKLWGWNVSGTGVENYSVTDLSVITATAAGVSLVSSSDMSQVRSLLFADPIKQVLDQTTTALAANKLGISDFMQTVMDDTTSPLVRASMGIGACAFSAAVSVTVGIPATTYTKVTFLVERLLDSSYSTATNRFTAPATRKYFFSAMLNYLFAVTGDYNVYIVPYKNGSLYRKIGEGQGELVSGNGMEFSPSWAEPVSMNAGEYMEIYAYANAPVSLVGATTGIYSYFSGFAI